MESQPVERFSLRICGQAGDGLQSSGLLVQKYLNTLGYYVIGFPGTQSTIRGGMVWQHIEFSVNKLYSFDRPLDLLIALRPVAIDVHLMDIKNGGYLLFNSDFITLSDDNKQFILDNNINAIPLPLTSQARQIDRKTLVLANTIAIGALIALLNLDEKEYLETLQRRFSSRPTIFNNNKIALDLGLQQINDNHQNVMLKTEAGKISEDERFLISGNEMIAIGSVSSGLKFLAQYPITPASSILTYLSNRARKYGVVVRQAEDELSAVISCIGASYTGARAMTASSGPGLSLMSEGFGYASMTETPIVIVNSMRAGPSTGVPTKMEQADLNSMIYMSHGESPRAILAPRSIKEAFDATVRAFNIADRYQMPVVILSDFALSESTMNLEPFDLEVDIDRGKLWNRPTEEFPEYKRYELTDDGISPRAFPGTKNAEYILVGAEHDELSHSLSGNRCGLPFSGILREQMFHKRFKKLESLRLELKEPELYGVNDADHTIICWGSTYGAIREAVDRLNKESAETWNMLSLVDLFPLPYEKLRPFLENIKHSIMYEVNYTGQLEELIHQHLDWRATHRIHPLSGETPTPSSVISEVKEVMK